MCYAEKASVLLTFPSMICIYSAGRARAASELARQGYMNEAKYLMTGNRDD